MAIKEIEMFTDTRYGVGSFVMMLGGNHRGEVGIVIAVATDNRSYAAVGYRIRFGNREIHYSSRIVRLASMDEIKEEMVGGVSGCWPADERDSIPREGFWHPTVPKSMSIDSKVGDIIRLSFIDTPRFGSVGCPKAAGLIRDNLYCISLIKVHSSYARVQLVGHIGWFNTVLFTNVP